MSMEFDEQPSALINDEYESSLDDVSSIIWNIDEDDFKQVLTNSLMCPYIIPDDPPVRPTSLETDSKSALVKGELRRAIQMKRLRKGETDLTLERNSPSSPPAKVRLLLLYF